MGVAKTKFFEKTKTKPWRETTTTSFHFHYLDKLLEEGAIESIDHNFATLMAMQEEEAIFLSLLFKKTREGDLFLTKRQMQNIEDPTSRLLAFEGAKKSTLSVCKDGKWFFKTFDSAMSRFFQNLKRLEEAKCSIYAKSSESDNFPLTSEQKKALEHILKENCAFICGGPGSGKTYLITILIHLFADYRVVVAAPTGKAAANIRSKVQSPNIKIATLHSLLKIGGTLSHSPYLKADLIILDEGSMIDACLFADLLAAIKSGSKCVFFGDPYQLPPVLPGAFFAELSRKKGFFLHDCHRTDLLQIIHLSKLIKEGDSENFFQFLEKDNDVVSLRELPPKKELLTLVGEKFNCCEDLFSLFEKRRFLIPLRKGSYGVTQLSSECLEIVSKKKIPILITANEPRLDLYNGDIAVLEKEQVFFQNGRSLPVIVLPSFEPAFFLSVHKSQGSEYDEVHILLPEGSEQFGRQMLYTAVTRARKKVVLYGNKKVIKKIIENTSFGNPYRV